MIWLIIGLMGFLGLHSLRILAPSWRDARLAAWGEAKWKGLYSVASIASFVLLLWGYGQARMNPVLLWSPPTAMRHVAALSVLFAFILMVAAYVPRNHIKARWGHPMILAIKLWAFAHLLANGWLHTTVFFGGFLLWSILGFRSMRRRPEGTPTKLPTWGATIITIVIAVLAAGLFAHVLHLRWIGVAPFPGA